jgi:hypothetical protein
MKIKRLLFCDQPHNSIFEQIYWPYKPFSPHNSKHLFDIYTLTHVFWPIVMVLLGNYIFEKSKWVFTISIVLSIVFEIFENLPEQIKRYRRIEIQGNGNSSYRGDSVLNVIGDIIANIIGCYLGWYLPTKFLVFILFGIFVIVTRIVGIGYWKEFVQFLIKF